jgi:hypothetical protein
MSATLVLDRGLSRQLIRDRKRKGINGSDEAQTHCLSELGL